MTELTSDRAEMSRRKGSCLCGAVRFEFEPTGPVLHCHCENCRHVTGNFIAAIRCVTADMTLEDPGDALRWFELDYAKYGFCSSCGSTLFFVAAATPETTSVATGSLDDASGLELGAIWFADEAQEHNVLASGVPHHDGNG